MALLRSQLPDKYKLGRWLPEVLFIESFGQQAFAYISETEKMKIGTNEGGWMQKRTVSALEECA